MGGRHVSGSLQCKISLGSMSAGAQQLPLAAGAEHFRFSPDQRALCSRHPGARDKSAQPTWCREPGIHNPGF
jgi:hypothetical protein